ncbi:hypothetical protein SGGMMB4_05584 [Sodalis glossinidius str. 'morsitans']|uniref:Uncharacterized protein n=1 Tax=Sodalis glossinidius (strain morsitans) TaxID=343509 RepID=A0A193QNI1_SODGM|nr:hypothetical protein SGGMMB4_05584 [Sodalis glossinidius str. 'morsitans']
MTRKKETMISKKTFKLIVLLISPSDEGDSL